MYQQSYDPLWNAFFSTVAAAIPIVVLLYFIALHPHRDASGARHRGIAAPYAAFYAVLAAFLISCLVFRMPFGSAVQVLPCQPGELSVRVAHLASVRVIRSR